MKRCWPLYALIPASLAACHTDVVRTPDSARMTAADRAAPRKAADSPRAITEPAPPDFGDPSQQFLVHAQSGEILLRSQSSTATRVLAAHADDALYHAALELVWFKDDDQLSVIDLRAPGAPAVVIARGMACCGGHLSIIHPDAPVSTDDDCDVPSVWLHWNEKPTIEAIDSDGPELRIVNGAWLRSQLGRPVRSVGERRDFGDPRIHLPHDLLDCEDEELCGTTVPFGARGLQVVTVLQKMGGACWQRACLLRDPRTKLFATPPNADRWGPASKTKIGSCGRFMFDRTQTTFLLQNQLCVPEHPCEELGGWALGWLVPGDTVGAPGDFE